MEAARPSKPRLLLFAFGDFAFNLFWQSVMLFLLFYYTDALDIPIAVAATTYMVASVWDGIANFVDRRARRSPARIACGSARILIVGRRAARALLRAAYLPPLDAGRWAGRRASSARICCSAPPMRR